MNRDKASLLEDALQLGMGGVQVPAVHNRGLL